MLVVVAALLQRLRSASGDTTILTEAGRDAGPAGPRRTVAGVPGPVTEPQLRPLVATELDVDPARLTPAALLTDDLGVDSLSAIALAMVIEDAYEVELPNEVLAGVHSYGDLVAVVGRLTADRA